VGNDCLLPSLLFSDCATELGVLKWPLPLCSRYIFSSLSQSRLYIALLLLGRERRFLFCTERERVQGPISVTAADVVAFFGIVCTSTRSKPDLAVESFGMTLLTHCAVRINRPKTEHVSRNQNARHVLAERTTDCQKQTAWPVLAFGDEIPLNTHFGIHPRRTTRHDVQRGQARMSCRPGNIDGSWMLCPARSVLANPSAIYVHNAIFKVESVQTHSKS